MKCKRITALAAFGFLCLLLHQCKCLKRRTAKTVKFKRTTVDIQLSYIIFSIDSFDASNINYKGLDHSHSMRRSLIGYDDNVYDAFIYRLEYNSISLGSHPLQVKTGPSIKIECTQLMYFMCPTALLITYCNIHASKFITYMHMKIVSTTCISLLRNIQLAFSRIYSKPSNLQ